jgi:pimeloyl-ACP methyl ester carboxylesterase
MTTEAVQSRVVDQPVFFPPDAGTYFGLVSLPPDAVRITTAVLLLSGTHPGSTTMGRNRMWVTLGRGLAERGHPTLRLDYAGLGESLPGESIYDLDNPAVDVFCQAAALLRSHGAKRIVVVGTCFGSRTALAGAAQEADIAGILLLAPPVRNPVKGEGGAAHLALYSSTGDLAKRAFSLRTVRQLVGTRRARRVARLVVVNKVRALFGRGPAEAQRGQGSATDATMGFLEPFRTLAQRRVPMRLVFGDQDMFWTEFEKAAEGRLGHVLERAGAGIDVRTVPGVVRGFTSLRIQELVFDQVYEWVEELTHG